MNIFFDIETGTKNEQGKDKYRERYKDRVEFLPELNEIICISMGYEKDGVLLTKTLSGNEYDIIKEFYDIIHKHTLIGWNIKGFDIPFIVKRGCYHNIPCPQQLKTFGKKPWEILGMIDLMEVYKITDYQSTSLELASKTFGVKSSKDGNINGGNVNIAYTNGDIQGICEYCEDDVICTYNVYKKMVELNLI